RRLAVTNLHGELGRNLQTRVGVALADHARHRIDALHFAHDAERLGVDEAIDELATLNRAVLVKNDQRHVLYVRVERITERDHFHERRKEHEEQRHRVAPDDDEFLEQNGAEAAEGFALHKMPLLRVVIPSRGDDEGPRTG